MTYQILFWLCSATLTLSAVSGSNLSVAKYEFSIISRKTTAGGKVTETVTKRISYRAADGRVRSEYLIDGLSKTEITLPEKKLTYVLNPSLETYY